VSATMTDLLYPCRNAKPFTKFIVTMFGPQSNLSARYAKRLFLLPMRAIGLRTAALVPDSNKRIRENIFLKYGHMSIRKPCQRFASYPSERMQLVKTR
jgi:hypothetical protein